MRRGPFNELVGRAHKSINLDEDLLVALREVQEHHETFSDVVNRIVRLGLFGEQVTETHKKGS